MNRPTHPARAGSLKPEFGGGHVNLDHTGSNALVRALIPSNEGGLFALSQRPSLAGDYVTKFTSTGELDAAFVRGRGFFHDALGNGNHLHLLADERILVTGALGNELIVTCYNADGTHHTPYGVGGRVRLRVSELVVHEHKRARLVEPTVSDPQANGTSGLPGRAGSLTQSLVAGDKLYLIFPVRWDGDGATMSVVVRLDGRGGVDRAFNQTGYCVVTMAGTGVADNAPIDAVVQPSAHPDHQAIVLLVAELVGLSQERKYLLCVTAQGLDYGFGQSALLPGYVLVPQSSGFTAAALLGGEGGLRVIGGTGYTDNFAGIVFGFTARGAVAPDFNHGEPLLTPGENGWVQGAFHGEGEAERMVLMTYLFQNGSKVALVRLLADGQPDTDFGDGGTVAIAYVVSGWASAPQMRVTSAPARDVLLGFQADVYWLLGS
ncbi:hypothetical protein RAM80_01285 [Pseudomonas sp. App30]|uniref:hypothetical protein n=1 Tax=Pseudomonas sp. App30 TaxID=3068990 RepID=UPI003A7FCD44